MDGDVGEGRCGCELSQDGQEPGCREVPDLVVGDADVGDDLFEPGAALEGELDLDRCPLGGEKDGVGEMLPPL